MDSSDDQDRDWLPPAERTWADAHLAELRLIFTEFDAAGGWPDPVELERKLRGAGQRVSIVKTANSIPPPLGRREHHEPRVLLTLLGLACVEEAHGLLDKYVATLRLALDVYDDPTRPRVITRDAVKEALAIDGRELDRLGQLLLEAGNPFSAGSQSADGDWSITIDERVVDFENVHDVDAFVRSLAHIRLQPPPASFVPADVVPESHVPPRDGRSGALEAAEAVGAIVATVLTIALAPLPWKVAAGAAVLGATVLHRRLLGPSASWAARVGLLAAAAIAGVATDSISGGGAAPPPPVDAQLATDLKQVAGFRVAYKATAHLHGGTDKSYVVVLRDANIQDHPAGDLPLTPGGQPFVPKSDQLRIYDERDGRLHLAFRFLPQSAGQVRQLPEGDHPSFMFEVIKQVDINQDGDRELIGEFKRDTLASGPYPVPVVLAWDGAARVYRLSPLIPNAPALARPRIGPASVLSGFTRPTVIRDRFSGTELLGHAVDDYRLWPRKPDSVMLGLFVDPTSLGRRPVGEVKAWTLDLQSGSIETGECGPRSLRDHLFAKLGAREPTEVLAQSMLEAFGPPCGRL